MIIALLTLLKGFIPLSYLMLDGHFGNNNAMQMSQQVGLFLLSKLRHDSELYLPYSGADKKRKYGDRLNPRQMDNSYLVQSSTEDGVRTDVYQLQSLYQKFAQPVNIVILLKTKLTAKLDQTRHKKGRRAKPRNGFYILIYGGFENKLL